MERRHVSSGSPWEVEIGFSRAVRVGPFIAVSGTVATGPDGEPVSQDVYEQARFCFRRILDAIAEAGGRHEDVVRVRMYVTSRETWPEVARAFKEAVGSARPAATLIEVSDFIAPGFHVEIEADAIVS
ncbi:MAG TPA: RidA family protein [Fimbriimonadaceae bacterium]|nr:RidA family protein [Fimbriimonadaceae bacterium]